MSSHNAKDNLTPANILHEDMGQIGEIDKTSCFPMIVRGTIIVQSPSLIKALAEDILNGYPGITHDLSRLEFRAPFQPFVHRWGDLLKFMKRNGVDETAKTHMTMLYEILESEMLDTVRVIKQHILNRDIIFDHAWMIFQPGCIVVSSTKSGLAGFELDKAEYQENRFGKFLRLYCECLEWNGSQYCREMVNIDLPEFYGTRKIKTLEVFPIELSDNKEQIKSQLLKQGDKFEFLSHYPYRAYSGPAITWDNKGCEQEIQVSGRIIIDAKSFSQFSPHCSRSWKRMSSRDYDMLITSKATQAAMRKLRVDAERSPVITLSSYHHMICRSKARGYSIKLKTWFEFFVSNIIDTLENASTFDDVLFSENMENIVSSFAQTPPENTNCLWTSNQIEHIDMNITILRQESEPKDMTAEAVSNRINIPLLTISSDDLGTSLLQTEPRLSEVLELVHQWNTLLLLDGFDFLLEKASNYSFGLGDVLHIIIHNLSKHKYRGPFFITTNREDDLYEALLSASG